MSTQDKCVNHSRVQKLFDWLECIWETDLPPHAKYLCAYLRTFMNAKNDTAWPSYARIIRETGLSRATVYKYVKVLEDSGWLKIKSGNSKESTQYTASFPVEIAEDLREEGSSPHGQNDLWGSSPHGHRVVRQLNQNKQDINKQNTNGQQDKIPYLQIQEYFNEILGPELGTVRSITSSRKKSIKARISDDPKRKLAEWWRRYFLAITEMPHLMGLSAPNPQTGKPWKANFDWLINETNMTKVVEKRYVQR